MKAEIKQRWKLLNLFDKGLVIFWSILSLYIFLFHNKLSSGWVKLFVHLLLIALTFFIVPWMDRQPSRWWHFIRYWYIVMGLPFFYWDIGSVIHGIYPHLFDNVILKFEMWLFGTLPNVWLQQFIRPGLTEIMQISYSIYWITIPLGGTVFYFKREYRHFEHLLFYVTLTFFISYTFFILFPVAGPRYALADQLTVTYRGIFLADFLRQFMNKVAFQGGAFPSSHVGVALVILIYVWHFKPRLGVRIFLPLFIALSCATIYGQYHYVTDVLAGIIMGMIIGFWGARRSSKQLKELIKH